MTRMCSYAKISKGGAGSADELRDTGSIIRCMTPLEKNQNFWWNKPCPTAWKSCCAAKTCRLFDGEKKWYKSNLVIFLLDCMDNAGQGQ